ncbi:MAG TPA: cation-transporting P-type ATPase, partial [Gaiellaceae bacterium]
MATTEAPRTGTTGIEQRPWHVLGGAEVAETLDVDTARGLSGDEAAKRLGEYGPNKFAETKTEPRWHAFLRQYRDPMQIVLLVAGLGSI